MCQTFFRHPTGETVIAIPQTGNCQNCDCGKDRFIIDSVLHDSRLTSIVPHETVREKFETLNEGFSKRSAPWMIWLIMIPLMLLGTFFFAQIRGSAVRCSGITNVCSADANTPDLSTCNKIWCCEPGFDQDTEEWSSADFKKAECAAMAGNETIGKDKPEMAELCKDKVELRNCGKCTTERRGKNKKEVCGVVQIQGKPGNFESVDSNFGQMMLFGQLTVQMGWILPLIFFLYRISQQRKFLLESFEDWKTAHGIEVKYFMPQKHSNGMLYLILPQGSYAVAQTVVAMPVVTTAQVVEKPYHD